MKFVLVRRYQRKRTPCVRYSIANCLGFSLLRSFSAPYSPKVNGKRMARNIYAPTEAECEEKLAVLIAEMKQELAILSAKKTAS